MKKNIITLAIVAISATAIEFCAAVANASTASTEGITTTEIHVHTQATSQGKHCSGTVGCDCSGFSPISNGKEWQKSYCKHCGHAKSCHK